MSRAERVMKSKIWGYIKKKYSLYRVKSKAYWVRERHIGLYGAVEWYKGKNIRHRRVLPEFQLWSCQVNCETMSETHFLHLMTTWLWWLSKTTSLKSCYSVGSEKTP